MIPRVPSETCRCVELRIPSATGSLPVIRSVIERIGRLNGLAEPLVAQVALAMDEALANVIAHAYEGRPDQPIDVRVEIVGEPPEERLVMTVRDFGRTVEPDAISGRDLADVRPGGLGVHIMQSVMDRVEYSPLPEGGMLLRLTKRIGPSSRSPIRP